MYNTERIDHFYEATKVENRHFKFHYGNLINSMNLTRIIQETQPKEIYKLATMSQIAHGVKKQLFLINLFFKRD
jgi:GDPmannose 4,6-dehydratase